MREREREREREYTCWVTLAWGIDGRERGREELQDVILLRSITWTRCRLGAPSARARGGGWGGRLPLSPEEEEGEREREREHER